jgi:hypothetical protein
MTREKYQSTKLILLALLAAAVAVSTATQTQARSASRVNSADRNRVLRITKTNPKIAKALTKRCGCAVAAPDDLGGWGSCFKNCLRDVGVSPYALIMCGAACAAAASGVGSIVCAICVGVSVTVIEVCALGCAAYPDGGKGFGTLMGKNLNHQPLKRGSPRLVKLNPAAVRA